jgi:lipopolysaccharide export system protein LptA
MSNSRTQGPRLILALAATFLAPCVLADRADREKPVNLEADKVSVDDAKKVLVFDGNVLLSQGTMTIRAGKLVVTQDDSGFQRGVATGTANAPARFRQKREGRDDYIEGEAERIEHDARTEKTEFFVRARVKSGGDEVTGNYISFDSITERYLVTGAQASKPGVPSDGRVRATIQPKGKPTPEKAPQ